jgi:peptide/nickel transport system substrate-binding protein
MTKRQSKRHLRYVLTAVGIVLVFILAACGGATETPTEMPEEASPTAEPMATDTPAEMEEEEPTATATEEAAEGMEREGTLRVSAFPIAQTDPAQISSDSEVLIANHVYDYLVDVDAENEIQPRLATDWTRSEDGLNYTFTLAEGVTFHDGSPLTADDVVYTFRRLRDTEGLPTTDLYSNITTIEATGDLEVTFTLSETNPFLLYDLSDNHALIVKDGTEDATDFNGTGPFRVTDYQPENRIVMEANENYFVEGQPHLQGLEIIFFNEQSAAASAVRGGQIDLTMDLSTPLYESLQEQSGLIAQDIATNQFPSVRLRVDQPPGNDPNVIQALRLATDREEIYQLVQQGYGAVGRDSPIGPLFSEYYTEETPIPERDPEQARQLLEDAGYPDGLDLQISLLDTLNFPDLAAVLKQQWAEAGINIEINTLPESVFYGEGEWLDVTLGIVGWGHRPYPQFYMDVMLKCDAKWNATRMCIEELDQAIETAGSTLDEQERVEAYAEIQRIMIEEGPIIVPYFFAEYGVISDRFEGFQIKAFSGRTDFRTIQLTE